MTDHAATRKILSDSRFYSDLNFGNPGASQAARTSFVQAAIQKQIIFTDGEEHRRVQKVILRESAHKMQTTSAGWSPPRSSWETASRRCSPPGRVHLVPLPVRLSHCSRTCRGVSSNSENPDTA